MSLLTITGLWATFMAALIAAGVTWWHGDLHWTATLLLVAYVAALTSRLRTIEARQDRVDHITGAWRVDEL